ncbi:MAG: flavodoxin domain-containing protein [Odoribacter sp.]|nr:flavodoxin domain-containing protein [Odoribacter sp.]
MEHTENRNQEAKQIKADLTGDYLIDKKSKDLKAIGLFYAPAGGNVHRVAKMIKRKIKDRPVDIFHITEIYPDKLLDYQYIILVSSTLGADDWKNDETDEWSSFLPGLLRIKLNGRKVGLVGLGDHIAYRQNFVDDLINLANVVREAGGTLVGKTSTEGYTFDMSRAVENGEFVGLPIDEDYEAEKTEQRIDNWLNTLFLEN